MSQIFISYSRKDKDFVDQLVSRLNAAGYEIWIDRLGIRGGEQWRREIVHAIGGSDVLILVLSPNSAKSDNVRKEVDLAEGEHKQILPVVIRSVTIPAEMKYQLAGLQLTDFTANFETGFSQLLEALAELVGPPKPVEPAPATTPSAVTPVATAAPSAAAQRPWLRWLAAHKVPILVGGGLLLVVILVTVTNTDPSVTLTKAASPETLAEPGGVFSFTLTIENTAAEPIQITALTDTNDLPLACTSLENEWLPVGASRTCSYTTTQTEVGTYPNTASVTVQDDDGSSASASASKTVTVTNTAPSVTLIKAASPETLAEPGGVFTFTLTIENTAAEPVWITNLTDDFTLSDDCTKLISQWLPVGDSLSCSYTTTQTEVGTYPNTASVTVQDDDGSSASETASKTVTVTNTAPSVSLIKAANPETLAEPDGVFTFILTIKNTAAERVQITALTDTYGLPLACTSLENDWLPVGASRTCSYTTTQTEVGTYTNTASVTVQDDDGSSATDTASKTVTVTKAAVNNLLQSQTWHTGTLVNDFGKAEVMLSDGSPYTWVVTNTERGGGAWHWVEIPDEVPGDADYEMTVEVKQQAGNTVTPVEILMLFRGKCASDGSNGPCNATEGYVAGYDFSETVSNTKYFLARWTRVGDVCKIQLPIRSSRSKSFKPDVEGKLTLTVTVEEQKYTLKANETTLGTIEDQKIEPPDEQLGIGVRLPENNQSATIEFHLVTVYLKN